jgi:two-component system, OmpR family, sensor histidine kinase BaeS
MCELKLHIGPTSIPDLLERVAEASRYQAERSQNNLTVNLEPNLPEVNPDPARMEQALGNLVSNAYLYTPQGEKIQRSAKQESGV